MLKRTVVYENVAYTVSVNSEFAAKLDVVPDLSSIEREFIEKYRHLYEWDRGLWPLRMSIYKSTQSPFDEWSIWKDGS